MKLLNALIVLGNERGQMDAGPQPELPEDNGQDASVQSAPSTSDVAPDEQADKENYRLLRMWRRRIDRAIKLRTEWEKDYRVKECEEYYLGKQYDALPSDTGVINHFLATVRVTLPNLVFDDPKYMVRPAPGFASSPVNVMAQAAEGALTSVAKHRDCLRNAARLAVLQNFFRIAVLKQVYSPVIIPNPQAGEPIYRRDTSNNIIYDPQTGMPTPETDPETGVALTEPGIIVKNETYRFEWTDASRMIFPDEGPDQTQWTWVGEQVEISLADAKSDENFPSDLREKFRASKITDSEATAGARTNVKYSGNADDGEEDFPEDESFCYTVIYNIKDAEMLVIAKDASIKDFLIKRPIPEGIDEHPYAILPGWIPNTGPDGGSPWPVPYTYPWLDLQDEYNLRRLQMRNGAARSARKILATKNLFENDEEARKCLQSATDMETVFVKDMTRIPIILQDTDLNPSIYKDMTATLSDWRLVTGQTGAKIGTPDADTATEATFVQQASNLRDADLQNDVNAWFRVAGRKMLQLLKSTLTLKMWVNIRGLDDNAISQYLAAVYGIPPAAMIMFPQLKQEMVRRFGENKISGITREDLQGDFEIDVQPGSTKPRSLASERAQWLEFLQIIATQPQIALSKVLLEETAAKYDFINPVMVEEVHALAMTMMQMRMAVAGQVGGKGSDAGNTPGTGSQTGNAKRSQAAQGNEPQ